MNYYEHHLGDYAAATAHLSLIEDAVYTRMIRRYYLQEGPLPADVGQVARLVGAKDPEALAAVEAVLAEFFVLEPDGWHQSRCDEEIARFRESEPAREAKRTNEKERQRRLREARSAIFEELRAHGVVPAWDTPMHELRTHLSRVTNTQQNAPATRVDTATQTPDTKHQEKQKQKPPPAAPAAGAFERPPWVPEEPWAGFEAMRRRERHPLTHRAAKLIVAELAKLRDLGHDPAAVLDQSTRNGWRDVFPIRTPQAPRAGPNGERVSEVMRGVHRLEEMKREIANRGRLAPDGNPDGTAEARLAAPGQRASG